MQVYKNYHVSVCNFWKNIYNGWKEITFSLTVTHKEGIMYLFLTSFVWHSPWSNPVSNSPLILTKEGFGYKNFHSKQCMYFATAETSTSVRVGLAAGLKLTSLYKSQAVLPLKLSFIV